METDEVTEAVQFIDSILAKVACSREDHRRILLAVDLISDAIYGEKNDKE